MQWRIQLVGDPADLRMLSESMCGGNTSICEAEGKYVLRSEELDKLQDAGRARARAEEIAVSLSGASRIILGTHKPLKVGGMIQIRDDGTRTTFALQDEPAVTRERVFPASVSITRKDGTVERHRPADRVEEWLEAAAQDPSIAKALRLRNAGNLTWVELYRIYEVIAGDMGGESAIVAVGWAEKAEIKLFKRTANSVVATGDQARHGYQKEEPPKNPISLGQAKVFIDTLLKDWVISKTGRG